MLDIFEVILHEYATFCSLSWSCLQYPFRYIFRSSPCPTYSFLSWHVRILIVAPLTAATIIIQSDRIGIPGNWAFVIIVAFLLTHV